MSIRQNIQTEETRNQQSQPQEDNTTLTEEYLSAHSPNTLQTTTTTTGISTCAFHQVTTTNSTSTSVGGRKRRMSVCDFEAHLLTRIRQTIDEMKTQWNAVNLDEKAREKRIFAAYQHMNILLDEMISDEKQMAQGIRDNIEQLQKKIIELHESLGMSESAEFERDSTNLLDGSLQMFKALRNELNVLRAEEEHLIGEQVVEIGMLRKANVRLGCKTSHLYNGIREKVLPYALRKQLMEDRMQAEAMMMKRLQEVQAIQNKAKRIRNALDGVVFSRDELRLLETDFSSEQLVISEAVLKQLDEFCHKHKSAFDAWAEGKAQEYEDILFQHHELECKLFKGEISFNYPEHFDIEIHDDVIISRLRDSFNRLSTRYQHVAPIFTKYEQWNALWKEKCHLEVQCNDPTFYNNRAGNLKMMLNRRRFVEDAVPTALNDLKTAVQEYQAAGLDMKLLNVEGLRVDRHAAFIVQEHQKQKELVRSTKKQTSILNASSMRMRTPTPLKVRRKGVTGNVVINKFSREEMTTSRWSNKNIQQVHHRRPSIGKIANRRRRSKSFTVTSCSQLSSISPKHKIFQGPKTSSPMRRVVFNFSTNSQSSLALTGMKRRIHHEHQDQETTLRTTAHLHMEATKTKKARFLDTHAEME